MPFSKLYSHLNLFLINIILLMLAGCGSFNSSSLVSSDGIYSNESNKENSTSKYYENYFKDKALELENDFVFNDSLISNNEFITSNDINYSSSNPSWGDIPTSVDYVIDYNPYRNRFFGYSYGYGGYYGMYPYYGYWNAGHSYYSMRNWYRYGWMGGFYPFYYNYYPYNWFGRIMPFGYRNRYSSYSSFGNSPYDNYLNRDYNNVSYNKGRRGSASNVIVYSNGTRTSFYKDSDKNKDTNINVGRSYIKDIDKSNNDNFIRIRTYQDFVKSSNTLKSIDRNNRVYSRPEGGVVKSTSGSSSNTIKDNGRRYYSNPTNSNNQTKSNWGLSGRNFNSSSSNNNIRSYSNPSSSSQIRNSYNSPSRSSSPSFSRPPSMSSSNSSSSSSSSSSASSRGSR